MSQQDPRPGVDLLRYHFRNVNLATLLPPWPQFPSRDQYFMGFAVRDKIAHLLLGEHQGASSPSDVQNVNAEICREVIAQGVTQREALVKRLPSGTAQRETARNSMESRGPAGTAPTVHSAHDGAADKYLDPPVFDLRRRVLTLGDPSFADVLLYSYLEKVALRMAKACVDPKALGAAKPEVWIGYDTWSTLDPYTKARVVLAAKDYVDEMQSAYQQRVQAGTLSSAAGEVHSLAHQHVPSLTARQARRSGISANGLRARWEM